MMALDKPPVKWLHDNILSIMSTNQGVGIPIRDIYTIHRWSSHDGIGQTTCKVTAWQHPVYNVNESGCGNTNPWHLHNPQVHQWIVYVPRIGIPTPWFVDIIDRVLSCSHFTGGLSNAIMATSPVDCVDVTDWYSHTLIRWHYRQGVVMQSLYRRFVQCHHGYFTCGLCRCHGLVFPHPDSLTL